jgi:diacylglycerol kinase (ATP)
MTSPTVQLFINPEAGSRSRARTRALCSALEALGARLVLTESLSDRLVVDERADHVCAVGGDGTLRHVVEAVRRAGRPIAISAYPAGTVNLLAMEYAYSRDPVVFAQRLVGAGTQPPHYAASIGQIPLLVCASVGPDSYAVAGLSPRVKRLIGRAAYLVAFCALFFRWPRATIALTHDGRQTQCEAVYIAKGRFFAGRWSFAPEASVGVPLLHVTALRKASRRHFLRFAWALLRGQPVEKLADVDCFACTELTLFSDVAAPVQADGDIVAHLPLAIRVEAQAIHFA